MLLHCFLGMVSGPNEGAAQTQPILYAAEDDQGVSLELKYPSHIAQTSFKTFMAIHQFKQFPAEHNILMITEKGTREKKKQYADDKKGKASHQPIITSQHTSNHIANLIQFY